MGLKLITPPATEPVTLAEAKAHLRVDIADDDALITSLIVAARTDCENLIQRALITQTWEKAVDAFGEAIELPKPPLISVLHVRYDDTNGVEQTLASLSYQVDNFSEPGWVVPAYGFDWPDTREQINAVRVRYTAGYGSAAAVPQPIKQWILIRVGQLHEHREQVAAGVSVATLPFVDSLLDTYRVITV